MTNIERIQANNAELREAIEMAESLPDVGSGGIIPTGTISIIENGIYEVTDYATAEVNVPTPKPVTEELSVTENGEYMPNDGVDGFSKVTVSVPAPVVPTQEKTVEITENGTVSVTPDEGYALSKVTANVNVPIPEGYIKPSGTKEITENGTHSVTEYDSVSVAVPIPDGYIVPSGTLDVSENGTHDVTAYASVNVSVVPPEESSIFDPTQETILTRSTATYKDLFVAKTMIAYVNTGKYAGYVGCKFDAVVGETYRISWDKISSSEEFVFYYESDTILAKVDDHYGTRIQHTNNPFTLTSTKPYVYIWVAHPAVPSTTLVFVTGLMVHEVADEDIVPAELNRQYTETDEPVE